MVSNTVLAGWVDLSDEDQQRAKKYLSGFRAEGTLDELGFGIMRDAIADVFFPATNTIMTHVRYLIFIPTLYLIIERERLSGSRAAAKLKTFEDDLRKALVEAGMQSVIGSQAEEKLTRYPSSIYWSSLCRLGIFLHPEWSQSYYREHLSQYYRTSRPISDDDDRRHVTAERARSWDGVLEGMIVEGRSWTPTQEERPGKVTLVRPKNVTFDLTNVEAKYLRDRFEATPNGRESQLLYLVKRRHAADFAYPWEAPYPDSLSETVHHARLLSMFIKGTTLQYYHMLVEARRKCLLPAPEYSFLEIFGDWWKVVRRELKSWDLDRFFALLRLLHADRADRTFFEAWRTACVSAKDAKTLLHDDVAQGHIADREWQKRPRKRRLIGGEQLRNWKPPDSLETVEFTDPQHLPYWLSFRSRIGCTFVREIVAGLERRA